MFFLREREKERDGAEKHMMYQTKFVQSSFILNRGISLLEECNLLNSNLLKLFGLSINSVNYELILDIVSANVIWALALLLQILQFLLYYFIKRTPCLVCNTYRFFIL
jgi:hypothetical protein